MTESRNGGTDLGVALLLAIAAVIAAAIGARASVLGDRGSDTWHDAVREDVRQGSRIVNDVRFVYQEDAPLAIQIAEAQVRSEEAEREARAATGTVAALLEAESAAQAGAAGVLAPSSAFARGDPETTLDLTGQDIIDRIVARQAKAPADLRELDPDATEQRGADLGDEATLLIAMTIPVALAFFCGAVAEGFPRWRRWLLPLGYALALGGLVAAVVVEVTM